MFRRMLDVSTTVLAALAMGGAALAAQSAIPWLGAWEGVYENSEATETLESRIEMMDGHPIVHARATCQYVENPRFQQATEVIVEGSSISFVLNWGGRVMLDGELEADAIRGDMRTDHWSGTWLVRRVKT